MAVVYLKPGESLDIALRAFKKKCERDGTLTELRKREYYKSKGERKREKHKQYQKRVNGD